VLPGVPLRVIPGAGHAPYIERADAFEREVAGFVR